MASKATILDGYMYNYEVALAEVRWFERETQRHHTLIF